MPPQNYFGLDLCWPTRVADIEAALSCNLQLEESVKKFWEIENFSSQMFQNEENIESEVHFQETFRIENDRFVVKVPFRNHSSGA